MKKAAISLLILSVVSFVFGSWGYFTESGQRVFDEMDGMIPFFALIASGFLVAIALLLLFIVRPGK